jgi:hypothetical protein
VLCCIPLLALVPPQGAPPGSAAAAAAAAQSISGQPTAVPVTLLLVDTSGPDEFLDLVRGGLSLGLEALPADSLVGLLGVSDCITLVDMAGREGHSAAHTWFKPRPQSRVWSMCHVAE